LPQGTHVVVFATPGPVAVGKSVDTDIIGHIDCQDAANNLLVPELVAQIADECADMPWPMAWTFVWSPVVLGKLAKKNWIDSSTGSLSICNSLYHVHVVENQAFDAQLLLAITECGIHDSTLVEEIISVLECNFLYLEIDDVFLGLGTCSVTMNLKSSICRLSTGIRKSSSLTKWLLRSR
jgi:hypothetical protein